MPKTAKTAIIYEVTILAMLAVLTPILLFRGDVRVGIRGVAQMHLP